MFQENNKHLQDSFFSLKNFLTPKMWEKLSSTWAATFYQEVFCRIDETLFACLYSEKDSRPNVPVNTLVSLEIIKSGFGWSDEELYEQASYNLQVRLALGLHNLKEEIFTDRTIYNFRKRVREYAEETGVNLMQKVFEQVTDEQLEAVSLETGWQRMDSTQVLSNLVRMTRLELMVSVLQAVYKGLDEERQQRYQPRWEIYLEKRPHQVCYRISTKEAQEHLLLIGQELAELERELLREDPESKALPLVQRILEEQYQREGEEGLQLRPGNEIDSTSLQSPHDLEATYRFKAGKEFRGGYVVNVSETTDEDNPVQLILDVQVEPNQTDDSELLKQSLDDQKEREIEVKKVTTDGGYTGPTAEQACRTHEVELRATRMRGGHSAPGKWGWEEYTWQVDEEGDLVGVSCPQGCQGSVIPGQSESGYIIRFAREHCLECPFYKNKCRVQEKARVGPTIYLKKRIVEVARHRQQLHPEDTPIRVLVESTMRSIKRGFPGGKLPVRGLIRARMMLYLAPMMVNARRIHEYRREKAHNEEEEKGVSLFFFRLARFLKKKSIFRLFVGFLSHFRPHPA